MLTRAVRSSSICAFAQFQRKQKQSSRQLRTEERTVGEGRTDHDVLAGEGEVGQLLLERVQEGHAAADVEGETDGLGRVDDGQRTVGVVVVQHGVERAVHHVLVDDDQVGRVVAAADDGQHVGVREDAQPRKLLVEVARDARRALAHGQDLGHDVVSLKREIRRVFQ